MTETDRDDQPAHRTPGGRWRRWCRRAWQAVSAVRPPSLSRLPRWWPVAACALLGVIVGGMYGLLRTPQYSATSYVAVLPGEDADPATALGFAQAYGRIATGGAVLHRAAPRAGLDPSALESGVRAVTSPDAPLIEITGSGARAAEAATVANAVANSLTKVANGSARSTGVRLTVFSSARTPDAPSSITPPLAAAVGGCAGGLAGGLLLLVRPRREARTAYSAVPAPASGEAQPQAQAQPEPQAERKAGRERAKEGVR